MVNVLALKQQVQELTLAGMARVSCPKCGQWYAWAVVEANTENTPPPCVVMLCKRRNREGMCNTQFLVVYADEFLESGSDGRLTLKTHRMKRIKMSRDEVVV